MPLFVKEGKENDFFAWQIFISIIKLSGSLKTANKCSLLNAVKCQGTR